jgi:hypothetical protein
MSVEEVQVRVNRIVETLEVPTHVHAMPVSCSQIMVSAAQVSQYLSRGSVSKGGSKVKMLQLGGPAE